MHRDAEYQKNFRIFQPQLQDLSAREVTGMSEVDVGSRAERGLRCRTGARTSAGRGQNMFGTRYYYAATRGVGGKRLRAALLASTALVAAGSPAVAQDATWLNAPGSGNFNTGANWDTATVPTGTAFFDTSEHHRPVVLGQCLIRRLDLQPRGVGLQLHATHPRLSSSPAPASSSTAAAPPSPTTTSCNSTNTSTAGNATITNNSLLQFYDTSTVGSATITNNFFLQFHNTSTAGSATITNNGFLFFYHNSTAGSAALVNNAGGLVDFSDSTGPNGDGKLSAGSIAGGRSLCPRRQ